METRRGFFGWLSAAVAALFGGAWLRPAAAEEKETGVVCLRCKENVADYCAHCIQAEKQAAGKRAAGKRQAIISIDYDRGDPKTYRGTFLHAPGVMDGFCSGDPRADFLCAALAARDLVGLEHVHGAQSVAAFVVDGGDLHPRNPFQGEDAKIVRAVRIDPFLQSWKATGVLASPGLNHILSRRLNGGQEPTRIQPVAFPDPQQPARIVRAGFRKKMAGFAGREV